MIHIPDSASLKFDSIYSRYILGVFLILSEFLFSLYSSGQWQMKNRKNKKGKEKKKCVHEHSLN